MISLTLGVIGLCLFSAAMFLRLLLKRRGRFQNVAAFVPGARLAANAKAQKRKVRKLSKKETAQIDSELPDLAELMAVALDTGETLQSSLELIAQRGKGRFADELRSMQLNLQMGSSLDAELRRICSDLPTPGVREFANKLAIAVNRGTPLALSLSALSTALRRRALNELLRSAGANETRMLVPLVTIVLPVTVIFALYPSTAVLQLGF